MRETNLKIELMRHGKVLTTHMAVVNAKGDLEAAVHDTFAQFRREHPDDTNWEINVSVRQAN
jgi:hypothetical protein